LDSQGYGRNEGDAESVVADVGIEPELHLPGEVGHVELAMGHTEDVACLSPGAPTEPDNQLACLASQLQTFASMLEAVNKRFESLERTVTRSLESVEARVTLVEGRMRFLEESQLDKDRTAPMVPQEGIVAASIAPDERCSVREGTVLHEEMCTLPDVKVVSSNSNARDPVVSQVISSNSSATEEFIDKIRDRFRETHELLEQTQPFHPKTAQVSPVSVLTMAC